MAMAVYVLAFIWLPTVYWWFSSKLWNNIRFFQRFIYQLKGMSKITKLKNVEQYLPVYIKKRWYIAFQQCYELLGWNYLVPGAID